MSTQRFRATLAEAGNGGVFVPVPFDPDEVWRPKPRHHVGGTVDGVRVRGIIDPREGARGFTLGPAWLRDTDAVRPGDTVTVVITPEGPQRDDLAEDLAAALDANPAAGAFFDELAVFYRKAYLRWIDGTRRRPDLRARRIAEVVALLEAGVKQRPKP